MYSEITKDVHGIRFNACHKLMSCSIPAFPVPYFKDSRYSSVLVCIRLLLVCTRLYSSVTRLYSSVVVCYSSVFVCYSSVTRLYSSVTRLLLVCHSGVVLE